MAVFIALVLTGAFLIAHKHPIGFLLLVASMLLVIVRWHASAFAYRCPACGYEFEISTATGLISPHSAGTKYLRCPKCGKRDWATVLKKAPADAAR